MKLFLSRSFKGKYLQVTEYTVFSSDGNILSEYLGLNPVTFERLVPDWY